MRYVIQRGIDLRQRQEDKLLYVSGQTGAAILVNNAHTLVHIVVADDPDILIRARIPGWLKGTVDMYLHKFLLTKFAWLLKTQVYRKPEPTAKVIDFETVRKHRNAQRRVPYVV